MQVETFECSETAAEPIEACDEAVRLMDELGLAGQKELVHPAEKTGFVSRCPYRQITADEMFVYQTLCPTATPLERYNASAIPLRVLQVAAHAKSLGMFKRLQVWDRAAAEVKDPVLVAYTGDAYDWQNNHCFILARWGEELETFATLVGRAVGAAKESLVEQADALAAKVRSLTKGEIIAAGANKRIEW